MQKEYYNPLEKQNNIDVKHAQVIYLDKVMNKPIDEIAEITDYAESTIKRYIKKFAHLLSWAKEIFTKTKQKLMGISYEFLGRIEWEVEKTYKPCAYIIEYFDEKDNFLWLKVGKTSQPLQNRVYQHLNKDYKGIAYKAVIKNYFECNNDDDALTMENMLRKYYKQQNNEKDFLPLDRFTEQRYNLQVMQDKKVNLQYELLMS
jgi:hypothetical protein